MGKHLLVWLILIAVSILALPIIVPPEAMVHKVDTEIGYMKDAFGVDETRRLINNSNSFYDAIFVQTGIIKNTGSLYVGQAERAHGVLGLDQTAELISSKTDVYLLSASANMYALSIRVGVLLAWLPYIIPFLAAAVIHGLVQRKVKMWTFGFTSPALYGASLHALIAISFFPIVYLLLPFPITPLFIPFWALLSSVPIILFTSNIQRIK